MRIQDAAMFVHVCKLDVSVSCVELGWRPLASGASDDSRRERMRGERAIYISIGDHIPLGLGQEFFHLIQVTMPVEQLADRVILKHPKVKSPPLISHVCDLNRTAGCYRGDTLLRCHRNLLEITRCIGWGPSRTSICLVQGCFGWVQTS